MSSSTVLRSATCTDPAEFEASINAVAGQTEVHPHLGQIFHSKVQIARLSRIGFLNLEVSPMRVRIDEAHGFFGLTVTLNNAFSIIKGKQAQTFDRGSAHLLYPDREFDIRIEEHSSVLGTNFFVENLHEHARRLRGDLDSLRRSSDERISMATPTGSGLLRYLMFVWGELSRGGGILNSDLVASEIEDGMIAVLVMAMTEEEAGGGQDTAACDDRRLARVEEYLLAHLCEPVSRATLAEVAGVSIRTLSRGFLKRRGIGPMAFLRRRRLEAARIDLLAGEPGSTSVSEIAERYGFSEPGKFSAVYKAAFDESPSETLRR